MNLRDNLIVLGAGNPGLRPHLRVLIASLDRHQKLARPGAVGPLAVTIHKALRPVTEYNECLGNLIQNFTRFSSGGLEYVAPHAHQYLEDTQKAFSGLLGRVTVLMRLLITNPGGDAREVMRQIKDISHLWGDLPRTHAGIFKQFHGLPVGAKDLYFDVVDLKSAYKKVEKTVDPVTWERILLS